MKKQLWINGQWCTADDYQTLKSPYSNEAIAEIAMATPADVKRAIDVAYRTLPEMRMMPVWQRSEILENVSRLLKHRKAEAIDILVKEASKPFTAAALEIDRAIEIYRFAADEAKQLCGTMIPMEASTGGTGKLGFTLRQPLGVIGAISPFNFPFNLVAHKVGPAIAAGNTVVLKPASQTPLSGLFIAELFHEAGLPAGALNVVTGRGSSVGEVLVKDPRVQMITFTGSVEVGKWIRDNAGMKRVTLELGSNAALIIDRDANLDQLMPRCIFGAFSFQGQICISIQRIYVHEEIAPEFTKRFVGATQLLKGGDPQNPDTDYSALITRSEADRVKAWIDEAERNGATILTGGQQEGSIITPTIIRDVPPGMQISCREAFGPIVVIDTFSQIDEAIEKVNNSVYGLQAGIYTQNIDHALQAAEQLHVGGVMINEIPTFRVDQMPYGGVKDSGVGREGLKYALEEMTEMKLVVIHKGFNAA